MTIAATSLAVALWERYGLIDAARRSSRKDVRQTLSMCCSIDNVRSRWSLRYSTDVLKERNRHKNGIKEWVSLVGLCLWRTPQHPHHVKVSQQGQSLFLFFLVPSIMMKANRIPWHRFLLLGKRKVEWLIKIQRQDGPQFKVGDGTDCS